MCAKAAWAGSWQVLGLVRKVPLPATPGEDEAVLEDFRPERRFGTGDREALVVVAVPFDVGFEEDVGAERAEAEEGRFALVRDEVVDLGR